MRVAAFEFELLSLSRSEALGQSLGQVLGAGDQLALCGPMGAGKTTLTRSLAQGFGVVDLREVASPTYAYAHVYRAHGRHLHHMDFYRLGSEETAHHLGLEEMLRDSDALCVVEWAELFPELLDAQALWLYIDRKPNCKNRQGRLQLPLGRVEDVRRGLPDWVGAYQERESGL